MRLRQGGGDLQLQSGAAHLRHGRYGRGSTGRPHVGAKGDSRQGESRPLCCLCPSLRLPVCPPPLSSRLDLALDLATTSKLQWNTVDYCSVLGLDLGSYRCSCNLSGQYARIITGMQIARVSYSSFPNEAFGP